MTKVFERLVAEVMEYLKSEDLLGEHQHGLRRGSSCTSQLLQHHNNMLRVLENGHYVDMVYLDFSKVFDRVDYGLPLRKLKVLGIKRRLITWIKFFCLVGGRGLPWMVARRSGVT